MKNMEELIATLRNSFDSGKTLDVSFRKKQLEALLRMYEENTDAFLEVLAEDLHKAKQEAIVTEVDVVKNDVRTALYSLDEWVKPDKPEKSLPNIMDGVAIQSDPYGVVLIIGAWNYPIQLTFAPLSGAIAAGNCAILKPSELAPASSKLIAELVPKYLDTDCYKVVTGGPEETTELLKHRFDYIFFTGSTNVARIVHQAAAKYLTPVTLELGGKCPVFLDDSVDIDIAAARIVWGKCLNSGQSCIAPDYLLCTKSVEEKFVKSFEKAVIQYYGEKVKLSKDYGRIINERHTRRLIKLLDGVKAAYGGDYDLNEKYIQPTLVTGVKPTDPLMQEEIFGPILPVVTVEDATEAIRLINSREKPLALYVFSNRKEVVDLFLTNTSSGDVTVNDTLMHFSCDSLPFGGVGCSGMGAYHGKFSFDTFSHKKGVLLKKINKLGEMIQSARYPPFSDDKLGFISMMAKKRPSFVPKWLGKILLFGLGAGTALLGRFICIYMEGGYRKKQH